MQAPVVSIAVQPLAVSLVSMMMMTQAPLGSVAAVDPSVFSLVDFLV
jgi:hypothetical protein